MENFVDVAEPSVPIEIPDFKETSLAVAPQHNQLPALPELPALPSLSDDNIVDGTWRPVDNLPALPAQSVPIEPWAGGAAQPYQPEAAPETMTSQLWKEHIGRGHSDLPTYLPDVGQQIDAGTATIGKTRPSPFGSTSARTGNQTGGFSLAGLSLMLDGLIGLFSLTWLFGPSKAPAVRLVLYAVPLELGVMAHNALTNKGVRATAVEYVSDVPGVMEEFFFNVPETQAEWTEYILRSIKLMWRRVDG